MLKIEDVDAQTNISDLCLDSSGHDDVWMNGCPIGSRKCVYLNIFSNNQCQIEYDDQTINLNLLGTLDFDNYGTKEIIESIKNDRDGLTYYDFSRKVWDDISELRKYGDPQLEDICAYVEKYITDETESIAEIDDFIKEIKIALPKIKAICSSPRMGTKTMEILQDVGSTKRINSNTIRQLASHSEQWKAVLLGEVIPKKLISDVIEDNLDIYENTFFKKAIDDLALYVREKRIACEENGRYSYSFVEKTKKGLDECLVAFLQIKSSRFYQSLSNKNIGNNIYHTNILNYDQRYKALYDLWNKLIRKKTKIECMRKAEGKLNFSPKRIDTYYHNFTNYVILSALSKIKKKKGCGPNFWDLDGEGFFDNTAIYLENDRIDAGIGTVVFPKIYAKSENGLSYSLEEKEHYGKLYIEVDICFSKFYLPSYFIRDDFELNKKNFSTFVYDDRCKSITFEKDASKDTLSQELTSLFTLKDKRKGKDVWKQLVPFCLDFFKQGRRRLIIKSFPVRFDFTPAKKEIIKNLLDEELSADAYAYLFPNDPTILRTEDFVQEYKKYNDHEIKEDFNYIMSFGNSFDNQQYNDFRLSLLPIFRALTFSGQDANQIDNSFTCYNIESVKKLLFLQQAYLIFQMSEHFNDGYMQICPICGRELKKTSNACYDCGVNFNLKSGCSACHKDFYSITRQTNSYSVDERVENIKPLPNESYEYDQLWKQSFGYNSLISQRFSLNKLCGEDKLCIHCGK